MRKELYNRFLALRREYPIFSYHHFDFFINEGKTVHVQFDFRMGEKIRFNPKMKLRLGNHARHCLRKEDMEGLVFHIGLIELLSYWKSACSPIVHIRPYSLSVPQQEWWKKLYRKGLGEFLYQNGIPSDTDSLIRYRFDAGAPSAENISYPYVEESRKVIVPVGGGKDSVVTLEELRKEKAVLPFIINPRGATLDCASVAGFTNMDDIILLEREIDPKLLELNEKGFLNGHTPFSAMLAFYSLLASYGTGIRDIALSNESSANEPTIPGTDINHQYSKSLEFEQDFRYYVKTFMNDTAHYYSYLRPFNELQIAEKFSQYPSYFPVFRSCNAGSKENRWCGQCPKCLFTAIILAPFLTESQLNEIFGNDILDNSSLELYFDQLTGLAENKPFECVGTLEEVNRAIERIIPRFSEKYLIQHYIQKNR